MNDRRKGLLRRVTGRAAPAAGARSRNRRATISSTLFSARSRWNRSAAAGCSTCRSRRPIRQFAARAADALVEEYVQYNFELRTDATRKSLQFLADEIAKQQKKVEDSERAMAQYRETNNALSLEDRQNTVVASLNQVNDQYTRTRTERIQKEALYNQIKSLPPAAARGSPRRCQLEPGGADACARGWPNCSARRCS